MKVLVIVDMQTDFISGTLGTPEAQAIVPNVINKMKEHKNTDTIILFTQDTHWKNYLDTLEGKKLPIKHCIEGTEGWFINKEIYNEFKNGGYATYSVENIVNGRITKPTFGSYELIRVLDEINIVSELTEIEFCGVCTDICVISNVIMTQAAFWNTPITVDASCCAGVTPESHQAALTTMKMCQINVIGE